MIIFGVPVVPPPQATTTPTMLAVADAADAVTAVEVAVATTGTPRPKFVVAVT